MINHKKQSGFTLVELAIVLAISGIILGSAIALMPPYLELRQSKVTKAKAEDISVALAQFAQNYGRLPCPAIVNPTAEPFGSPRGSGADGSNIVGTTSCSGTNIGIVPFRALGLVEDNIRDGYGNYFTYAVNPSLTQFDARPASVNADSDAGLASGSTCTSVAWKDGTTNKNIYKAHVCCPTISAAPNEIKITDAIGASGKDLFMPNTSGGSTPEWETYPEAQSHSTENAPQSNYEFGGTVTVVDGCEAEDTSCSRVDNVATTPDCIQAAYCHSSQPDPGPSWLVSHEPNGHSSYGNQSYNSTYYSERRLLAGASPGGSFIAFTIISHGKNGDGAFYNGGPGPQRPASALATAQESENRNNDLTFVDRQKSTSDDNNYFDDIVVWKTNEQLVSYFGNNSCAKP